MTLTDTITGGAAFPGCEEAAGAWVCTIGTLSEALLDEMARALVEIARRRFRR